MLRKVFRVFTDAVQKCGFEFVKPGQTEKISAGH